MGILDATFEPIEGYDKAIAWALKRRNRLEPEGQMESFP